MRRDKTFAQTLLIFSIANFVLAAPVVERQTRFDDFVLLPDLPDDETTGGSALLPHRVIDNHFTYQSPGSSGSVAQGSPPSMDGSLHQYSAPVSVAPQSNGPPLASEAQPLLDHPPPASEATQLHPLPWSGAQSSLDDMHPSWDDWRPVPEIEMVEGPNVHHVPDVHNDQDDYHNIDDINNDQDDYHNTDGINKLFDKWSLADLARFTLD